MVKNTSKSYEIYSNPLLQVEILLIILAIGLRFYYQFVEWSVNGDEIDLAENIILNNGFDLFKPLRNNQSAPPLFLLLEKISFDSDHPRISLKIIPFLASVFSFLLLGKLSKKNISGIFYLIPILVFAINPFILENSLTIKQYCFDLLFTLLCLNYFLKKRRFIIEFLFFSIWCFASNVGLFFCAAFVIFNLTQGLQTKKIFFRSLKNSLSYLLAPIPYLIYFIWYNYQVGAKEIRDFMTHYWSQSFMPLNSEIFKWIALQINAIRLFIFSSYLLLGLLLLLICAIGIFSRPRKSNNQGNKIFIIFLLVIAIHLVLSVIHLYPFSDRLLLYLSPFFILGLGKGLDYLCGSFFRLKKSMKVAVFLICFLSLAISYTSYLPKEGNNLADLTTYLKKYDKKNIYLTRKSQIALRLYSGFIKDSILSSKLKSSKVLDLDEHPAKNTIILSSQPIKFGHKEKRSNPEGKIAQMLKKKTVKEAKKFGNIIIYEPKQLPQP